MELTTWTPEPSELPWDPDRGGLTCPGCPEHGRGSSVNGFELVLDGRGLEGEPDQHDAVRVIRRAPGLGSGPFAIPVLPEGMPAIAVIDYLERQTFDVKDTDHLIAVVGARFPAARLHVWSVGSDVAARIAEDADWENDQGVLRRAPVVDIAPYEYPMDVGWRLRPETVHGPDGRSIELWRGCLYVEPDRPDLVRYEWDGLGDPDRSTNPVVLTVWQRS
jgi:hypothetical protein